jgi:hypothetical protein
VTVFEGFLPLICGADDPNDPEMPLARTVTSLDPDANEPDLFASPQADPDPSI